MALDTKEKCEAAGGAWVTNAQGVSHCFIHIKPEEEAVRDSTTECPDLRDSPYGANPSGEISRGLDTKEKCEAAGGAWVTNAQGVSHCFIHIKPEEEAVRDSTTECPILDEGGKTVRGRDKFSFSAYYRGSKLGSLFKSTFMAFLLVSVVVLAGDSFQTYNDFTSIDIEDHITDADFQMNDEKSSISGTIGFDIPEMGSLEKSIVTTIHVTIIDSEPTTDGDYEFEYKLGSGERFYEFSLDDLDPVTVQKIESGQPLDLEYYGSISVSYLGLKIPSIEITIPTTTTVVQTAN